MRIFWLGIIFLFLCCTVYAVDIPRVLQQLGYSESNLVSYDKEGSEEFFTFSDLTINQQGDTITFILENGKVKQTIKGNTEKFSEKS